MPVRRRMPHQRLVERRQENGIVKRYKEMGIAAALSRPWDYPTACRELAELLRHGYAGLPKAAKALVASDVLTAFRLLPDVHTGYALPAANGLLQAVEVSLPKQKKSQAISEFKCSVVAHKRRARVQQEPGPPHIPHDVLVHIFSFLDMRSLVAAGLVCWYLFFSLASIYLFTHVLALIHTCIFPRRSWNSSANDNQLWKMNYSIFFSICDVSSNSIPVSSGVQNSDGLLVQNSTDPVSGDSSLNWKEVFHNKRAEYILWSSASNKAVCRQCQAIIWLSNLTCAAPHQCPNKNEKDGVKLTPLLPSTVTGYILNSHGRLSSSSDSDDTDSDSEDNTSRRFWSCHLD